MVAIIWRGKHRRANGVSRGGVFGKVLAGAAISACIIACLVVACEWRTSSTYERIAHAATTASDGAAVQSGDALSVDSASLLQRNGEYVAWLTVDGTSVSLPVVNPIEIHASGWYLNHDFDGSENYLGCPFLDVRSQGVGGRHLLVYGHNIANSHAMFSDLHMAYEQDTFDNVGTARLVVADGSTLTFEPAFAMSVDESYGTVQRFEFADGSQVFDWLVQYEADASAGSASADKLIVSADRVLTLATCTSNTPGRRWRTLVVFVLTSENGSEAAHG